MEDNGERIGLLPALGEAWSDLVAGVASYEAVEEELVDVLRLRIDADAWVEVGGAAFDEEDYFAGVCAMDTATGKCKVSD
jgi:hypothetical protein